MGKARRHRSCKTGSGSIHNRGAGLLTDKATDGTPALLTVHHVTDISSLCCKLLATSEPRCCAGQLPCQIATILPGPAPCCRIQAIAAPRHPPTFSKSSTGCGRSTTMYLSAPTTTPRVCCLSLTSPCRSCATTSAGCSSARRPKHSVVGTETGVTATEEVAGGHCWCCHTRPL